MNKKKLSILEAVFRDEISSALDSPVFPGLYQANNKAVRELAADGYLQETTEKWRGITFKGYVLTHLGRMTYCETCTDEGVL